MPTYLTKSFKGGISEENKRGIPGSYKFGYGLASRSDNDVLTCGLVLTKESGSVVVDKINFIIACSDGNAYAFGNAGKIYKRKSTTWTLEYTDANGNITGAIEWNGYIYWCCTNGKISRIATANADGSNWSTDVAHDWQTGLATGKWNTMKIANGQLWVCNGQYLAQINYAAAAFTAQALDLIPGNVLKCLEESGDYVIIGSTKSDNSEEGWFWTWTSTATSWIKKLKLAAKGINAMITTEKMLAQAGVNGGVYHSDLSSKEPLFTFPDNGYCDPGGVDGKDNVALFGVWGSSTKKGGVYGYGRRKQGKNNILSLDYVVSAETLANIGVSASTIEIGAVKMVNGTLLVAWKNTTGPAYGVDALHATNKATGVYESLEFDAGQPMIEKHFKIAKITMEALPASCSIAFKYKMNKASSWTTAKTIDESSSFSTENETRALFAIDAVGEIFEFQLTLTPNGANAPTIISIATDFDFMKGGKYV